MKARYVLYSLSVLFMLVFSACEREEFENLKENGKETAQELVSVPSKIKITPFGCDPGDTTSVKAVDYTAAEMAIKDFWLIQFGADGALLASVYHAPNAEGNLLTNHVQMDNTNGNIAKTKTVWIVANTGDAKGLATETLRAQLVASRAIMGSTYANASDLVIFEQDGYKFTTDSESSIASLNRADGAILMSGKCAFDATDLYNPYPDGTPNYEVAKNGLEVTISSMVAKLTINYNVNEDAGTLNTIKLFRVPSKVSFNPTGITSTDYKLMTYEYRLPVSGNSITVYIPQNKQQSAAADDDAINGPNTYTAKDKTEFAPPKATYFSLGISKTLNKTVRNYSVNIFSGGDLDSNTDEITSSGAVDNSKIDPEDNAFSNYNINANAHYTEVVNVTDSNVESYLADANKEPRLIEILKEDITSNCYILNPLQTATQSDDPSSKGNYINGALYREECYALPIVQRVNEGWGTGTISEDTEWMVEVIWQDVPGRQVFFAESSGLKGWVNKYGKLIYRGDLDSEGSKDNNNYATRYYGKGNGDNGYVYIFVKKETIDARTAGNVLIGLKIKNSNGTWPTTYKWSWHLWVTDYDPDFAGDYTSGNRARVPGDANDNKDRDANIFHFSFWDGNLQHRVAGKDGYTSKNVKDYGFGWIMDRHLGALGWRPKDVSSPNGSATNSTDESEPFGLYYQWGRKDPFPARNILFDRSWNGAEATIGVNNITDSNFELFNIRGNSDLVDSENNSLIQRITTGLSGDIWTATNYPYQLSPIEAINTYPGFTHNWNHNGTSPKQGTKSIYDPCPPGWEVPESAAYRGFVTATDGSDLNSSRYNSSYALYQQNTNPEKNSDGLIYQTAVNSGAWRIDVDGTSSGTVYTYFPCSGWLHNNGGKDMKGIGDIWCAEQKSSTIATFMYIGEGYSSFNNDGNPTINLNVDNGTSYFTKSLAFSVRCVKK